MATSFYLSMFMHLLFILLSSHYTTLTHCSSSTHQLCHDKERDALLQFRQSFIIDKNASINHSAYPKVDSWRFQGNSNGDCCLWDGVECDENSGHVISLDLSSSLLYGSINSSSSLFRLAHLRSLNLGDNQFNYSQIPYAIDQLSGLTSLNLFASVFFGQIPSEILNLSKLASLDLSFNDDPLSHKGLLKLEKPSLRNLVQNLSSLKELSLSLVNISSKIPNILTNLSSFTSLSLRECGLYGEFPIAIFHMPSLQTLSVGFNQDLIGSLHEFNQSNLLEDLRLGGTNFFGKLPNSFENLKSLNVLYLGPCNFTGSIPSSLGNLTQLTELKLRDNNFHGSIPQSIFTLSNLVHLDLGDNYLSGTVESDMFLKLKALMLRLVGKMESRKDGK